MIKEDVVFKDGYKPLAYGLQMTNPILDEIHMEIICGDDNKESKKMDVEYRRTVCRMDSDGRINAMLAAYVYANGEDRGVRIMASVSTKYVRVENSDISDEEFIDKVKKTCAILLFPYLRAQISMIAVMARVDIMIPIIDTAKSIDNNDAKVE